VGQNAHEPTDISRRPGATYTYHQRPGARQLDGTLSAASGYAALHQRLVDEHLDVRIDGLPMTVVQAERLMSRRSPSMNSASAWPRLTT
jgi:hypothetical protein